LKKRKRLDLGNKTTEANDETKRHEAKVQGGNDPLAQMEVPGRKGGFESYKR